MKNDFRLTEPNRNVNQNDSDIAIELPVNPALITDVESTFLVFLKHRQVQHFEQIMYYRRINGRWLLLFSFAGLSLAPKCTL